MADFGHLNEATPSLAIALLPGWRGKGIGTRLLTTLLNQLRDQGIHQVSLSVQRENPALHLYRRLGFQPAAERGSELLMIRTLSPYNETIKKEESV